MNQYFAPKGYVDSLNTTLEYSPKIFITALQYRGVIPILPNPAPDETAVLCIANNCFNYATNYALYDGEYEVSDGESTFAVAPICSTCSCNDIDDQDVIRWQKRNVTLNPNQ